MRILGLIGPVSPPWLMMPFPAYAYMNEKLSM